MNQPRLIHRALLVVALLTLAECSGGGTGPSGIAGHYKLRSVNGSPVPVAGNLQGALVTIQSGFFQLSSDKGFESGLTIAADQGGTTITQELVGIGTWDQNDDTVQFSYSDGSRKDVATVSGDDLSMTSGGLAFTFRR